jgi:endonuclease YncB( thermonuclease family)
MMHKFIQYFSSSSTVPTWETTVPFVPPIQSGYVIKVYDGDTFTIASKLPYSTSPTYRFNVRLSKIDCAELKTSDKKQKKKAIEAKDALVSLIYGKKVYLRNVQTEKYGRLLADVYIGKVNVNQYMLDNKFAEPYDGGAKR